ncbi:MAG TPA: TetR/AcrR family transcriptional regulator [Solirubrobacteraceae bacterium]|nr:TetR/AcrR family transcriptional regulator [Solirubrobacteraceae bacterium]
MAETGRQRPYRQTTRAQAKERTRETLLRAASEEVERDGWNEASLEAVAQRAGVTKQTALRHFGSKKGLLDAVVSRTSSIVIKERDEAPVGDVAGAVANLVRHYERYGEMVTRLLPYRDAVVRVLGEEHRDSFARRAVDRGHEVHEQWVLRTFEPQLSLLQGEQYEQRLAQLVAVCDVYMWKILRRDLGLSIERTKATLVELIERLVEPDASERQPAPRARKPRRRTSS